MIPANFKKDMERLYMGLCNVYEYKSVRDESTKLTSNKEVLVQENVPCRLSYSSVSKTEQGTANAKTQVIKLFTSSEIDIKAGSKIVVTQNNKTGVYKNSSEAAVYASHQEIVLDLFEGWS